MKPRLNTRARTGLATSLAAAGLGAMLLTGGGTAGADETAADKRGAVRTISMVGSGRNLRFEDSGSGAIDSGATLQVVNRTNPRRVGPHTFSLVYRKFLPRTQRAQRRCFDKGHICRAIARWHGANDGPPFREVSRAGAPGWSTKGSVKRRGDSWLTQEQGSEFSQPVSAAPGALYYLCAVHPSMQGRINVAAPPMR